MSVGVRNRETVTRLLSGVGIDQLLASLYFVNDGLRRVGCVVWIRAVRTTPDFVDDDLDFAFFGVVDPVFGFSEVEQLAKSGEMVLVWVGQHEYVKVILGAGGPDFRGEVWGVLVVFVLTKASAIVDVGHHGASVCLK